MFSGIVSCGQHSHTKREMCCELNMGSWKSAFVFPWTTWDYVLEYTKCGRMESRVGIKTLVFNFRENVYYTQCAIHI